MGKCNDIDNVLNRSGTGQNQRFVQQLDPSLFKLNDFKVEDWLMFSYNFARHVNYFDLNNTPKGDWQDFFNAFDFEDATIPFISSREYQRKKEEITEILEGFKAEGKLTPHLTLFVCFLELLEHSKTRFNGLTKRHLDFYYKNILQVDKRPATPDEVHVIFELAKKSVDAQIVKDTALNGKADANGNLRIYKTDEELIANQAKVASLKTVYTDTNLLEIKSSDVANTLDGLEEPLPEDQPYWLPFGYTSDEEGFMELPDASVGFAVGSPLFLLQEGLRTVQITLNFQNETIDTGHKLTDFDAEALNKILRVYASGEKEWIGPLGLKTAFDTTTNMETKVISNNQLLVSFQLDKDLPAVLGYDNNILKENYNTDYPLVKFNIDTSQTDGVAFHRAMANRRLSSLTINVDVREATAVHIENDNGVLQANKPFFPFTPQPIKASNFYVGYDEVFAKDWTTITINFDWKDTPDDFSTWYAAYKKDGNTIVEDDDYFKASSDILHEEDWEPASDDQIVLFTKNDDENAFGFNLSIENDDYETDNNGPIRLRLETPFFHKIYSNLYTETIIQKTAVDGDPDLPLPNAPYTPLAENISINYTAEETRVFESQILPINNDNPVKAANNENAFSKERIRLFHVHPFGQCEEHNYLKLSHYQKGIKDAYDETNIHSYVVPKYCHGGELFIGLEHAQVQQNISLLVQVLEGSENPEAETFEAQESIQWAVLCDNKWMSLKDHIVSNDTGNFLSAGIIRFGIPRQATQQNTRLPEGFIWIRAKMQKAYDAVCKAINIHAQAVQATFEDNENELSHLDKGLEANTISKLITRIPQVKGVTQPYSSFNGKPEESDHLFYRRISERLRHKNRAVTLWDYEHLILQKFPEVFKVKCLNHTHIPNEANTDTDNYVAAGHVTLVVIPDCVNRNVFDIYQPRVSRGLISKIYDFINALNTPHVNAHVINPDYEEVKVTLEVEFYEGYDKTYYSKKLEEDITKFLSPWAFDSGQEVNFGVDLHKSVLIDYMEKLPYVDYLQNVSLEKNGNPVGNVVAAATPRSILVSSKHHDVKTVLTSCKGTKTEENLTCQ